jgi:hypothetical protein
MENRDRDKVSKNTGSTSAGDINRNTSSQIGKNKSDSSADFGQNVGRSENLNEPSSRTGSSSGSSGYGSSGSSRSGSSSSGSSSTGSNSMGNEPRRSESDQWSGSEKSSDSRH